MFFSQVRDFPIGLYRAELQESFSRKLVIFCIGLYRAELQETFSCKFVIFPLVCTGSTCKNVFLAS